MALSLALTAELVDFLQSFILYFFTTGRKTGRMDEEKKEMCAVHLFFFE